MGRLPMIILLAVVLSATGHATTNNSNMTSLAYAETIWKEGSIDDYYATIDLLIMNDTDTLKIKSLRRAMILLMPKDNYKFDYNADGIISQMKIADVLFSHIESSQQDHLSNLLILSEFIGHVRSELINDFEPLTVYANVPPPEGFLGWSGMNPDAIKDPKIRAEYKSSIEKNSQNNRINKRQHLLTKIDRSYSKRFIQQATETLRMYDLEGKQLILKEWATSANLSEMEIATIRNGWSR